MKLISAPWFFFFSVCYYEWRATALLLKKLKGESILISQKMSGLQEAKLSVHYPLWTMLDNQIDQSNPGVFPLPPLIESDFREKFGSSKSRDGPSEYPLKKNFGLLPLYKLPGEVNKKELECVTENVNVEVIMCKTKLICEEEKEERKKIEDKG